MQSSLRWDPGTVDVNSGARLKFVYGNKGREPHTISVVNQDQLPATVGQVFNCEVCNEIFDIQDGMKRVLGAMVASMSSATPSSSRQAPRPR